MKIKILFIGEGTSDAALVDHIQSLVIMAGASEVSAEVPDFSLFRDPVGHSVQEKLKVARDSYTGVSLYFVHRDSDNAGREARCLEIQRAAENLGIADYVAVVPVKEIESWLLADQSKIRVVAGSPTSVGSLGVPSVRMIEKKANAKETLENALCRASGLSGSRLKAFRKRFSEMRYRLLSDLDHGGPVARLPSYQSFVTDLNAKVASFLEV